MKALRAAMWESGHHLRLPLLYFCHRQCQDAQSMGEAYKGFQIADKSETLTQWYEDNNEAILFGRYLRVNENDRWRFWHDKWVNDPGLKEEMSDYFQMEEWKENKRKNDGF